MTTKTQSNSGGALDGIAKMLIEFAKFGTLILWYFVNGLKKKKVSLSKDAPLFVTALVTSLVLGHIDFFHAHWPYWVPEVMENILFWYKSFAGPIIYDVTFFGVFIFLYYAVTGKNEVDRTDRIKKAVKILSKGNDKTYPKVIKIEKLNEHKTKVLVDSPFAGLDKFKSSHDDLESGFNQQIESISRGRSPKYIQIILNTKSLPKKFDYSEVREDCTKPCHFILGESRSGLLTQDIRKLPHMLIAGTTNFGKSNFFKQVLLNLLQNTDHIQMHLIDLKGGLEMKAFKDLPNVNFVSDIDGALTTLRNIKQEMDNRFDYLYKVGHTSIVPKRDKKDRIVLAIDEASVLYMKSYAKTDDGKKTLEARKITDELAKLARAAGINIVIATQKVTKETLDTHIRENMSGRVSFKANDNAASMTIIGNTMATDLPAIPGRAIFHFGSDYEEFQAPLLADKDLEKSVSDLRSEHIEEHRKVFQPELISDSSFKDGDKNPEEGYEKPKD